MEYNKNMVSGKSKCIPIVVEDTAFEGVKKVALKSAGDMEMVCGIRPQVIDNYIENDEIILFATSMTALNAWSRHMRVNAGKEKKTGVYSGSAS